MKKLLTLFLPTLLFLAACDSPEKTLESLQREIGAYAVNPTPATEQKVEQGFQKLASEISNLRSKGKTSEADSLQRQANTLRSQYETARLAGSINKARQAIQGVGESFQRAGEQIGELFKPTPTPPSP
jgi:hypothetical protein